MPEVYAMSRLDALRRLRDEGYAVVDRDGYERLRAAVLDLRRFIDVSPSLKETWPSVAALAEWALSREPETAAGVPVGPERDA